VSRHHLQSAIKWSLQPNGICSHSLVAAWYFFFLKSCLGTKYWWIRAPFLCSYKLRKYPEACWGQWEDSYWLLSFWTSLWLHI